MHASKEIHKQRIGQFRERNHKVLRNTHNTIKPKKWQLHIGTTRISERMIADDVEPSKCTPDEVKTKHKT